MGYLTGDMYPKHAGDKNMYCPACKGNEVHSKNQLLVGHLYNFIDPLTGEWTFGLLSKILNVGLEYGRPLFVLIFNAVNFNF